MRICQIGVCCIASTTSLEQYASSTVVCSLLSGQRLAQAGAAAVLIANRDEENPDAVFAMSGSCRKLKYTPPCVMISFATYKRLRTLGYTQIKLENLNEQHLQLFSPSTLSQIASACTCCLDHILLAQLIEELKRREGVNVAATLDEREPDRGCTVVHVAVQFNAIQCLRQVLEAGAHPDLPKSDGFTPLHMAMERDSHDIVSFLLEFGAFIDHPHTLGWTPLHFCAKKGNEELALLLIQAGAQISAVAKDGCTPLHIACLFDRADVAGTLVAYGASLEQENDVGQTPFDFARRSNSHKTHAVLLTFMGRSPRNDDDPVRHYTIELGNGDDLSLRKVHALERPPWGPTTEFFEEGFLVSTRSAHVFQSIAAVNDGCKCVMPVAILDLLLQAGVISRGERIQLNDTPLNRLLLLEAVRNAANVLHQECAKGTLINAIVARKFELDNVTWAGFPPELDLVTIPLNLRSEVWLAAMAPIDRMLREQGLTDEVILLALELSRKPGMS
jgi:hypothetical protein